MIWKSQKKSINYIDFCKYVGIIPYDNSKKLLKISIYSEVLWGDVKEMSDVCCCKIFPLPKISRNLSFTLIDQVPVWIGRCTWYSHRPTDISAQAGFRAVVVRQVPFGGILKQSARLGVKSQLHPHRLIAAPLLHPTTTSACVVSFLQVHTDLFLIICSKYNIISVEIMSILIIF